MRDPTPLLAFVAIIAARSCQGLMVKRPGGTEPVAVELARESVEPTAGSASRFVELSHAANKHASNPTPGCLEEGCILASESTGVGKSLKKRMQKRAKQLKNRVAEQKKIYLENHNEDQYNVLKEEAVLEALERENAGEDYESGWA